ncbi:hypothetical protein MBLNU230_g7622t1 [Neophaeotheca triangularis]
MPTPSDTTLPPAQETPQDSPTSHLSCPPDEALRDPQSHNVIQRSPSHELSEEETAQMRDMITQREELQDAQAEAAASAENALSTESQEKEDDDSMLDEDSGVETSGPAPLPTSTTSSFLRPGSKFHGTQQSDRQVYDVQVEIKDVNMAESFLCGYLRIQGLTDNHPTLTTYFEGEIISPKHTFRTTHPSWGATEKIDLQHWARFPPWRPLAAQIKRTPNFTLHNYQEREHLFMRWKEYFLVPDHRVRTITGASFEGFYYICFNQAKGTVSGIYFHSKSERYQQLELRHVEDRGCVQAMEFR